MSEDSNEPSQPNVPPRLGAESGQPQQPGWGQPASPYGPGYGQSGAFHGQVGYPQPGYGMAGPPGPGAPYGRVPMTGEPYSEKGQIIAGVLQLLVGTFGVGRFYTGHIGIGVAQLLTLGGCGIWALVDGIMILVGDPRDAAGRPLHP